MPQEKSFSDNIKEVLNKSLKDINSVSLYEKSGDISVYNFITGNDTVVTQLSTEITDSKHLKQNAPLALLGINTNESILVLNNFNFREFDSSISGEERQKKKQDELIKVCTNFLSDKGCKHITVYDTKNAIDEGRYIDNVASSVLSSKFMNVIEVCAFDNHNIFQVGNTEYNIAKQSYATVRNDIEKRLDSIDITDTLDIARATENITNQNESFRFYADSFISEIENFAMNKIESQLSLIKIPNVSEKELSLEKGKNSLINLLAENKGNIEGNYRSVVKDVAEDIAKTIISNLQELKAYEAEMEISPSKGIEKD